MGSHFLQLMEQCGFNPNGGGSGVTINQKKVTMTAAQLNANLPVNAIPAPGAGKYINIVQVFYVMRCGANVYVITGAEGYITLSPTGEDDGFWQCNIFGIMDTITDQNIIGVGLTDINDPTLAVLEDFINKGIDISFVEIALADGDGEMDFYILYQILTL